MLSRKQSAFVLTAVPEALLRMIEAAIKMGVTAGVAEITLDPAPDIKPSNLSFTLRKVGPHGDVRQDVEGKSNVNFRAVVAAKIAQTYRTGDDESGHDDGFIGEVPYRGAIVVSTKYWTIRIGYSGGTEDQDVEIAKAGSSFLLKEIQDNA